MGSMLEQLWLLLLPSVILLHLAVSPFTKVEESFNAQAAHDILFFGVPTTGNATLFLKDHYDHVSFPGSVPRTFVGALALAGFSRPFRDLLPSPFHVQLLLRALLGLYNAFALLSLKNAISKAFGRTAGLWFIMLQASQFHVVYYASRTLPNMYALGLSTFAIREYLKGNCVPPTHPSAVKSYRIALFLLTVAGVIFRSELALLVATMTLYLLATGRVSLLKTVIPAGITGAVVALATTVGVDSFFWQQFPLWPEWSAFYYNTIQGHSADWGVSPWHYYFLNALPRLLLNPMTYLLLIPLAIYLPATRRKSLDLLIPMLAFVGIYSFLPHKEWRFIIYVIPALTAVASAGASWIWDRRTKSVLYRLMSLALVASVLLSFAASTALLGISSLNYPGGVALARLRAISSPGDGSPPAVYLDNLACQTGVTRFVEKYPSTSGARWSYDKTEDETLLLDPAFWTGFDYILAERPEKVIGKWEVLDVVYGFGGLELLRPGQEAVRSAEPTVVAEEEASMALDLPARVARMWALAERVVRPTLTRGWWMRIRMDPKIRILARQSV